MIRSFRYRLRPSKTQAKALESWLTALCELYNAALQERREAWAKQRITISLFDQMKQLPAIRAESREFSAIPVVVLRGVLQRLDDAFKDFFRRCRTGEKPGFPRFKAKSRWKSFSVYDLGGKSPIVAGGKRVAIPLLGKVKLHVAKDRCLRGTPKALRITRDLGKWFVTFACVDVPIKKLPPMGKDVGIDLGLCNLVATSDNDLFVNPRPLIRFQSHLKRAQRRIARRKRGSNRRQIAIRLAAKKHAHIANIRRENAIAIARSLVSRYDTVFVEALNIRALACSKLGKSVRDAAWSIFRHWLACKAEEAGRQVVEVDPRGTSQSCSSCGCVAVEKLSLSVRTFRCSECGMVLDRDVNAARNIKGLGLVPQGAATPVRVRRRSAQSRVLETKPYCFR